MIDKVEGYVAAANVNTMVGLSQYERLTETATVKEQGKGDTVSPGLGD